MIAQRAVAALVALMVIVGCDTASDVGPEEVAAAVENRWEVTTQNGLYDVKLTPRDGNVPIGAYHEWVIEVRQTDGSPVYPAQIIFDGGMPAHGHGLPSAPRVTDHLGDGRYRLEGVRFNMAGRWTLTVGIDARPGADRAQVDIKLAF